MSRYLTSTVTFTRIIDSRTAEEITPMDLLKLNSELQLALELIYKIATNPDNRNSKDHKKHMRTMDGIAGISGEALGLTKS